MAVCECIKSGGLDPSRLAQTSPYGAGGPGVIAGSQRHSWVEVGARGSVIDIGTTQDVDSVSSSPGIQRVKLHISFSTVHFMICIYLFLLMMVGVSRRIQKILQS